MVERLEVDGLEEFIKDLQFAVDKNLPKRVGQANKKIGEFIISHLQPRPTPIAVGEGKGATVRPSATKRAVVLRAGGGHRQKIPEQQWGKQVIASESPPKRPFILGTAERNRDHIMIEWTAAILDALDPAFHDTK